MKSITRRKFVVGATAATVALSTRRAFSDHSGTVTFGLTPVFLDSDLELLSNLELYLSSALRRSVHLVKRRTYQEVTSLLISGQLDAAWICGYPYVRYRDKLSLLAVPLYRGKPLYRSYVIVGKDNPTKYFSNLRGKTHAFSDPDSNSGFLVTRHLLASMNESPASFFRRTMFTFGHRNVIRSVATGLTDSGSVDGYVWDVMRETEPDLVAATRVIQRSEPMGFPPITTAAGAKDSGLADEIANALFNMGNDELGQRVLTALRLDGFVPGNDRLYDGIAERYNEIKDVV